MRELINPRHHAYLLAGERKSLGSQLADFLKEHWDLDLRGNPDCSFYEEDTFGIEHARALKGFASGKAFSGLRKVIVLSFASITVEAQNALLKVLEEPTKNTYFFLIVPPADILLPTLRSRLFQLAAPASHPERRDGEKLAREFLGMNMQGRLAYVKKITDSKDKQRAIELIGGLELVIRNEDSLMDKETVRVLRELAKTREYLHDRSSSLKLLLEHVSLVTPFHR